MTRALLVALTFGAAGCANDTVPAATNRITVLDDNGDSVSLSSPAKRIVSLVPAATDIIIALNAAGRLVGRTVEDGANASSVGTVLDPSIERIVDLEPDLVIAWADADVVRERLAKTSIPTYSARFERITHGASNIRRIGTLMGAGAAADSIAKQIERDLDQVRGHYAQRKPVSVLYLLQTEPLWTAGPNTFVSDLIEIAGGRNIFKDLRTQWSQISLEAVVVRQPDVIVVAQPKNSRRIPNRLLGVRTQRIYFVDSDAFNSPTTNVASNARLLANLLHPEN